MFTEGGSLRRHCPPTPRRLRGRGTDNTAPGSYAVSISQSAQQAVDAGSATWASTTSTLAQAETYTVTGGAATATYAATAGETLADVVNGMNAALAAAGIDSSAALVGSAGSYQFQLASAAYGSAAGFQVTASGPDQLGLTSGGTTYSGTDVAGTINGLPAVGSGQDLSSVNSGERDGLVLQITTPGITSATALGSYVRPRLRPGSGPHRHDRIAGAERHHPGDDRWAAGNAWPRSAARPPCSNNWSPPNRRR